MQFEVWHDLEKKPIVGEIIIVQLFSGPFPEFEIAVWTGEKFLLKNYLAIDITILINRWASLP